MNTITTLSMNNNLVVASTKHKDHQNRASSQQMVIEVHQDD